MNANARLRSVLIDSYPSVEDLRRGLPEIGDALQGQLADLYCRPSADGAERVAANLDGARRAALRLREAILREEAGDVTWPR